MSAPTSTTATDMQNSWRVIPMPVVLALVLGVAMLGAIFYPEAAAAVSVWYNSTAYSHCFFVLPIAAYLGWERRHALAGIRIEPVAWVVVAAIPLGLAWLAAERLGIMEGRQLIAVAMLELLCLAVLGWRMYGALAAPLLYLFFLVPFGAFLTPALQDFTAVFIDVGLKVLGIPHYSDAYIIEIPEGRFYVAEACAGLRFLIASIAFGVLYACLMYRSPSRRLMFMAASVVIPIIANGFRALGIVVLGHVLGSAEAAAADHLLYGWIFFSIVIMLLIFAGLPFREDPAVVAVPPAGAHRQDAMNRPQRRALFASVAGIGAVSALLLGVTIWLDRAGDAMPASPIAAFATPPGCAPAVAGPSGPGFAQWRFACSGASLDVTVQVFSPRVNPARIVAAQRRLTGELESDEPIFSDMEVANLQPRKWRIVTTDRPVRSTAFAVWIDGQPAVGGLSGRLLMARNSLFGAAQAPVMIAVSAASPRPRLTAEDDRMMRARIEDFLARQVDLGALVGKLAASGAVPPPG